MLQRLQTIKNMKVNLVFIHFQDKKAIQGAKAYETKQKEEEDKKDKLRRKRNREQNIKNLKKKGNRNKD
jgi:hypothetical protein